MNTIFNNWKSIGDGQEAEVWKGSPDLIEGLGGILDNYNRLAVCKRINWNHPASDRDGHDLFCKNLVLDLLEEYFLHQRKYLDRHIPRPLGSFNNNKEAGYYYCHIEGSEGFPTLLQDEEYRILTVELKEWNSFIGSFYNFGFDLSRDIVDPNDSSGKNIILKDWDVEETYKTFCLPSCWKRIDFGSSSCGFDYQKFQEFIKQEKEPLIGFLDESGYKLLSLAAKYSQFDQDILDKEKKYLEELVLGYRKNNKL